MVGEINRRESENVLTIKFYHNVFIYDWTLLFDRAYKIIKEEK